MAFNKIKELFGKQEAAEKTTDPIGSLNQELRNRLNVIRDAYQRTGEFTGEQLGALSFVKDELESQYGTAVMEQAISEYMKTVPESRLGELKDILERNSFMKSVVMKSLAEGNQAGIDRAKSSLRVLSPETFSTADVEALCAEVMNSDEYQEFILARVKQETAAVATLSQNETAPMTAPVTPTTLEQRAFVPNPIPKELDPGKPRFAPIEKSSQVAQVPDPRI